MKIPKKYLFLMALLGGVSLALSFPFSGGILPLAFVAFVPLLIINFQGGTPESGRYWFKFLLNYFYFVLYNALTCWWIYYASSEGVFMAIFANALLMTLPFAISWFIARQLGEGRGLLALLVLWLSFEYAHYFWELSWPWLNLGHIPGNFPKLIQWYEYSGVLGGTFWILFINILIYLVIRNVRIRKESFTIQTPIFLFMGLGILIPVLSSLFIYYRYEEKTDPVDIVVIQPNIEAHHEKFYLPWQVQLDKMFKLADPLVDDQVDLVLLPETAIHIGLDEKLLDGEQPIRFVQSFQKIKYNVPVLIGAFTQAFFREEHSVASRPYDGYWYEDYNTALLVEGNKPIQVYHKSKLVLGAEKLPFASWFPFLKQYAVELGGTAGVLGVGDQPVNFEASGLHFAPLICYESVYGEYASYFTRKGADILTVITNDGWWQDTPGYKQHRMFSQIRAIENRRSIARSANTGISCFIDQRGEIISELGWNETGALRETINRNTEFTFYVAYGDIFGRISLFLAIGLFIFALVQYLRKKGIRTGV